MQKIFTPGLYLLSATVLLLTGCTKISSDDLEEDVPYHQLYRVWYDASNSSTKASGEFRVRTSTGAGITLNNDSYLTINGMATQKDPIASIIVPTYSWTGNSLADVDFVLHKKNGETYSNTVRTSDVPAMSFPSGMPASYSKNNSISFSVVSASPDNIELMVKGENSWGQDTSFTRETGTAVHITATELDIFQPGTIEVHLTRQRSLSVPNADHSAGGHMEVAYSIHKSFGLN